jgi:hypothetical protein
LGFDFPDLISKFGKFVDRFIVTHNVIWDGVGSDIGSQYDWDGTNGFASDAVILRYNDGSDTCLSRRVALRIL